MMIFKKAQITIVLIIAFMVGSKTFAGTFTGTITTTIGSSIVVTEGTILNFGIILIDLAGDTISVGTNNAITIANSSTSLGGNEAADFRVEANANTTVGYSFSTGDVLTGPGADIPLSAFVVNRSSPLSIPGNGRRDIKIGATITVPPAQIGGVYTGTYTITFNYE